MKLRANLGRIALQSTDLVFRRPRKRFPAVLPVRQLAFPERTFELDYSSELFHISHREDCGIFLLPNVVVHGRSGLLLHHPVEAAAPVVIQESSFDDIGAMLSSVRWCRDVLDYRHDDLEALRFDAPVFLFNVRKRKKNYYHFVAEDLLRLLTVLEKRPEKLIVLHQPDLPAWALGLLEVVARHFPVELRTIPQKHFRVATPTLVVEDTAKRFFGLFAENRAYVDARIEAEGGAELRARGVTSQNAVYVNDLDTVPYRWDTPTGEVRSNTLTILPSRTSVEALEPLLTAFARERGIARPRNDIVVISRARDASRGRNFANEEELLAAIPEAKAYDFGHLGVEQQMEICANAGVLIGLLGAGLANLVFLRRGAALVEVFPRSWRIPRTNHFRYLCELRGIHHVGLWGGPLDRDQHSYLDPTLLVRAVQEAQGRFAGGAS